MESSNTYLIMCLFNYLLFFEICLVNNLNHLSFNNSALIKVTYLCITCVLKQKLVIKI